ncbi:MAG: glycoside hydrolase family 2 [Oscillospiraceae bacterium]|nr:glycoside hydrolase family 2 [Oscillospiraceae bacterium]
MIFIKKTDIGNFTESIHLKDYERPFYEKQIGVDGLICDYGRERISLDGEWRFGVDQYDNCLRSKWYEEVYADGDGRPFPLDFSFEQWETITVPSCWNLLKERYFLYEGSSVYVRDFPFEAAQNERVFLRFGAANSSAKVFLNKQYIGMHTGGYTPFCFEVGELLKSQNRLLVVVNNTRKSTGVPYDNTDWFNYGGLFREVSLLRVPRTFIKDFFISLVPSVPDGTDGTIVSDGTDGTIQACVKIDGADKKGAAVLDIPALGVRVDIPICDGDGKVTFAASPSLWSPENPHLYDMTVTYGEDILRERVGFREISVKNGAIFLNGQEIFLKGVCTHEESVQNGNALTECEIRENFALAKEMGCNFMRLAHYPHHEAAARIADEVGLMLWEEIPVYWAIAFDNADVYKNAENQLSELIVRDRNRACVIIWSVGNENADTDDRLSFMTRLAKKARELDHTRLISAACIVDSKLLKIADRLDEHLDVIGINEYYGWYEPDFSKLPRIFENSRPYKPVIISEFGADAKAKSGGTAGELYTEANQRAVYEKQLEVLGGISYVKGISPWIFYDFRCPRRLHHMQNYYNIKGLLSADKKYKKPAFEVMREFYSSR